MFGRNGESPVPIVAPQSPGDCFDAALEAARIAVTYRTPVMLLSDGMLANGSEPWRIPELDELPTIDPGFATAPQPGRRATTTRSSGPTSATRRPWPGRGPSPARPVSSTASAASRRPTATATSPTTRPTTTSWSAPARPRWTGSPSACRPSRSTTRRQDGQGEGAGARLGLDVRADRRRLPPGPQRRLPRRPGAPAPPQPAAARPRRDPEALRPGADPRDEPRPARAC